MMKHLPCFVIKFSWEYRKDEIKNLEMTSHYNFQLYILSFACYVHRNVAIVMFLSCLFILRKSAFGYNLVH